MQHLSIILEDLPGSIAVVCVSVHDGQPPGPELSTQLLNSDGGTVEATASSEGVLAGMMVPIAGEDEGVVYLAAPYPDGCRHGSRCGEEGALKSPDRSHALNHVRGVNLMEPFVGDGIQVEGGRSLRGIEGIVEEHVVPVEDPIQRLGKIAQPLSILVVEEDAGAAHRSIAPSHDRRRRSP